MNIHIPWPGKKAEITWKIDNQSGFTPKTCCILTKAKSGESIGFSESFLVIIQLHFGCGVTGLQVGRPLVFYYSISKVIE